ncbi:hypothetical protein IE53DRAFT_44038 [Violaceomyces palustris]|uniref:Uncharacterized protein n=1 Tax=Violaceomyces palustris TaxID=1673888 RepID=A0ACD0P0K6_9BASI|nr:hypothetical protein IE53DRAFT_44038 [Violaceomyces palustris]
MERRRMSGNRKIFRSLIVLSIYVAFFSFTLSAVHAGQLNPPHVGGGGGGGGGGAEGGPGYGVLPLPPGSSPAPGIGGPGGNPSSVQLSPLYGQGPPVGPNGSPPLPGLAGGPGGPEGLPDQ